jgi:hypothetical protein
MSSGLVNSKTLIPPFNFGRRVEEEDWDRIFPNGPKRVTETEEGYNKRKVSDEKDD